MQPSGVLEILREANSNGRLFRKYGYEGKVIMLKLPLTLLIRQACRNELNLVTKNMVLPGRSEDLTNLVEGSVYMLGFSQIVSAILLFRNYSQ